MQTQKSPWDFEPLHTPSDCYCSLTPLLVVVAAAAAEDCVVVPALVVGVCPLISVSSRSPPGGRLGLLHLTHCLVLSTNLYTVKKTSVCWKMGAGDKAVRWCLYCWLASFPFGVHMEHSGKRTIPAARALHGR